MIPYRSPHHVSDILPSGMTSSTGLPLGTALHQPPPMFAPSRVHQHRASIGDLGTIGAASDSSTSIFEDGAASASPTPRHCGGATKTARLVRSLA